jgi:hypothetical protein
MMLTALLIVFVVLQAFDAWTTIKVLRAGGRELNSVVAKVMAVLGRDRSMILLKFASIVTGGVLFWQNQTLALAALTVFYAVVVGNNLVQMRKMGLV